MASPIESYALIGDTQTAALVGRDGSHRLGLFPAIRFWGVLRGPAGREGERSLEDRPRGSARRVDRRYRDDSLILETTFETETGVVSVIDFMPVRGDEPDIVRVVEGRRGQVDMQSDLVIRFDYGRFVPWVRRHSGALLAIGGPDALCLRADVPVHGEDFGSCPDSVDGFVTLPELAAFVRAS